MKTRNKLYAEMGDWARQERMRKAAEKYKKMGMSPEMAESQADVGEAGEMAQMPKMEGISVDDIEVPDSSKAIAEAAQDADEDEEMQKWMAKQKG